jgi:hypothetical protein
LLSSLSFVEHKIKNTTTTKTTCFLQGLQAVLEETMVRGLSQRQCRQHR